jgi:hypothetical protein
VIAARLRDLFDHVPGYDLKDLHLLKIGRHFRLNPALKIVVGKSKQENEQLQGLAKPDAALFEPADFRGPACLATGLLNNEAETIIGEIIARYSQDIRNRFQIRKRIREGEETIFAVHKRFDRDELALLQVGG